MILLDKNILLNRINGLNLGFWLENILDLRWWIGELRDDILYNNIPVWKMNAHFGR